MKKKLLIFAHRGEARAFLSKFHFQSMSFLEGLYSCADHFLLITGEGPWNAGPKLALVLGKLGDEISEVINLGLAGALRESIEVGQIYKIRTVYLEQNSGTEFSSHTLQEKGADLITCHSRVLEPSLADQLDNFAPLVDRELWSLATVCSKSGHKLKAYKLISDKVGETEICQRVKERADEFSRELLNFYVNLEQTVETKTVEKDWDGFYFTTSLRNQREKLLHSLTIKHGTLEKVLEKLELSSILNEEVTPKKKASILIEKMKSLLNPVQKELQDSLQELSSDLIGAGAQVKFSSDFERPHFHLSAYIERQEDLVSLIKAMEEFEYPRFIDIIEGKDLNV
ncbi:MAG: hypothetical protein CME70_24335 [Halobacteriovorax sp.]|nr:hypothetical protein [Halobacteriovorax sp.]|tara:strand:+ start:45296 stop:46318 length:1023 start_codon:yes stop_codon:yes gene_type:complete